MTRQRFFKKCSALVVLAGIMIFVSGCKTEDEPTPAKSDGYFSAVLNGKTISSATPIVSYSSGYLTLTPILEVSGSEGYIMTLNVSNPKVGTFTGKAKNFSGSVCRVAGSLTNCAADYELTQTDESTITFSSFDEKGYAEGTFALMAKTKSGQPLSLSGGKFRFKVNP